VIRPRLDCCRVDYCIELAVWEQMKRPKADVIEVEENVSPSTWPLVLYWGGKQAPLSRRVIEIGEKRLAFGLEAPRWLDSRPTDRPFDFCGHMERLCSDIVRRCSSFGHIDVTRLLFAVTPARSARKHGLQARVTPMRFHGGTLLRRRNDTVYQVQR